MAVTGTRKLPNNTMVGRRMMFQRAACALRARSGTNTLASFADSEESLAVVTNVVERSRRRYSPVSSHLDNLGRVGYYAA